MAENGADTVYLSTIIFLRLRFPYFLETFTRSLTFGFLNQEIARHPKYFRFLSNGKLGRTAMISIDNPSNGSTQSRGTRTRI